MKLSVLKPAKWRTRIYILFIIFENRHHFDNSPRPPTNALNKVIGGSSVLPSECRWLVSAIKVMCEKLQMQGFTVRKPFIWLDYLKYGVLIYEGKLTSSLVIAPSKKMNFLHKKRKKKKLDTKKLLWHFCLSIIHSRLNLSIGRFLVGYCYKVSWLAKFVVQCNHTVNGNEWMKMKINKCEWMWKEMDANGCKYE